MNRIDIPDPFQSRFCKQGVSSLRLADSLPHSSEAYKVRHMFFPFLILEMGNSIVTIKQVFTGRSAFCMEYKWSRNKRSNIRITLCAQVPCCPICELGFTCSRFTCNKQWLSEFQGKENSRFQRAGIAQVIVLGAFIIITKSDLKILR